MNSLCVSVCGYWRQTDNWLFSQIEIVIANWVKNLLLQDLACIVNIPNYIATSVVPAICAQETTEFQWQQSRCFMFVLGVHHHRKGESRKFITFVCAIFGLTTTHAQMGGDKEREVQVNGWFVAIQLQHDKSVDTNIEQRKKAFFTTGATVALNIKAS